MKQMLIALVILTALLSLQNQTQAAEPSSAPVYQVTVVQTPAKAINYRNLKGSAEIDFKGTVILPEAKGTGVVKNNAGTLEIKAKFANLTPATQFGPEYLTYVFWAISPDGRATNLGELILDDGKSEMKVKTPLQSLSLLVTAEPYFAVSQPSNVVILENALKPGNKAKIESIDAKYELLPRGQYTKNIAATDLQAPVMDKKTPVYVYQARNAVRIAKAAGAETYAADGYNNAQQLLAASEKKEEGKKRRVITAREAVQAAEDSRAISVKRQEEETLTMAKSDAATATENAAKADAARVAAEQAKGQSDAERAEAITLASKATEEAAVANSRAQKAEDEKVVLRAQLLQQLNAVLQTRDTARGLIVNMSDVLFKTGSSQLGPPVREKLAKIAGIVSSHPGLKVEVEGYTDSVGSDESNQQLSEKRAGEAMNYLISQGVSADSIASKGFGETAPIASNDTAEGRQKNRRVEMIVSGDAIDTSKQAF